MRLVVVQICLLLKLFSKVINNYTLHTYCTVRILNWCKLLAWLIYRIFQKKKIYTYSIYRKCKRQASNRYYPPKTKIKQKSSVIMSLKSVTFVLMNYCKWKMLIYWLINGFIIDASTEQVIRICRHANIEGAFVMSPFSFWKLIQMLNFISEDQYIQNVYVCFIMLIL